MRFPVRFRPQSAASKAAAAVIVALLASLVALTLARVPGVRLSVELLGNVFYDSFYHLRTPEDRTNGDVVIVAVDQKSLDAVDKAFHFGWPWPREFWGAIVQYLDQSGARAVVFDLLFTETSVYARELGDDDAFAERVNTAKVPVVFGAMVGADGSTGRFAPPVEKPTFGAVNVGDVRVYREYPPVVNGKPSLALQAVQSSGAIIPERSTDPFLLHYYGPHQRGDGARTFQYLSAVNVIQAAMGGRNAASSGITPEMFKGKIVLIGAITAGTYDIKSSPLSKLYPGVEVQATAIENLLAGQRVRELGTAWVALSEFGASALAALGVLLPRRVWLKLGLALLAAALLIVIAAMLFVGKSITWLPVAAPLVAVVLATVGAFAWSYVTEDRARRLILKALSQYVSPAVAAEIARTGQLSLGGQKREMTVMFTDLAGFTDLSEKLSSDQLEALINFYLDEMSGVIFSVNGTVDKYIGDAIMSFWNAPLGQGDHAIRACRAALLMQAREEAIRPQLAELGAKNILTRIGINSGPMHVGNFGSRDKFNYTVLGDSVNLGSRLEGANKFYDTKILIAETTAAIVKEKFILRQLDVLRVKGKLKPMAVYELMAEVLDGADSGVLESMRRRASRYEAAFALYRAQKWDDAEAALRSLLGEFPRDAPSRSLLTRIETMRHDPPAPDWDGVYVAKEK
ncbi:MAG: CHASE2 domain-containing protein [Tepidisphaeraceae bacterium]